MAVEGKHGVVLAGRYRLLAQLGEGGMGSVWRAEHLTLQTQVAVKIIDPEIARLEFNLARFLREAKTLAALESPHVVRVLDYGSDADTAYLVMELLDGETLGHRLDVQGRLSVGETNRILQEICTAMSMVHERGLIHRDLKPDNIFLCAGDGRSVTKVMDFGIAKSLRAELAASMQTRTGHMLGTPSHMSPEQCRGLKDIDHRTDLWSLGVIAYQCLVGKEPFQGEVLGELVLRICMDPVPVPSEHSSVPLPRVFDAWFAKAVARDRAARFQSAAELAAAFERLSTVVGVGVVATPRVVRLRVEEVPAPTSAPESSRSSVDTESNTSLGLGVLAGRKLDSRVKVAGGAFLVALLGLGLWLLRGPDHQAPDVRGELQSLRSTPLAAPPAADPASPQKNGSVASGRRWRSLSASERPSPSAAPVPENAAGASAAGPEGEALPQPPSPAASSSAQPHAPAVAAPPPPRAPRSDAPGSDIRQSR